MSENEKRRTTRYRGALPIEFEGGKGISRDFSVSGIFFETDKSFYPGQPIEFTLKMEYLDTGSPVGLKCIGKIVRVEEKGEKLGVAVAISSYSFEKIGNKTKETNKHRLNRQLKEVL